VIVAISAFLVGLSAEASTVLSQAHGAEVENGKVAHLAFHASLPGLGVGLVIALFFWIVSPPLFALLGARDAVLDNALAHERLQERSLHRPLVPVDKR
jgi:Na+-driven multidrug efflux pump